MIVVHSLAFSRAHRVIWLLEALKVPYKVVRYERTGAYKAPDALAQVHPLGKAPVLVDDDFVLAESAAILRYVQRVHGDGRFLPEGDARMQARHDEWLDYAEGTLARLVGPFFWHRLKGRPLSDDDRAAIRPHLAYLSDTLEGRDWLMGERLCLADMQIMYQLAMLNMAGELEDWPVVQGYWQRIAAQPELRRSIEVSGPIMPM
ncbi:Glutathione S-transferase GST-4.5 [Rhodobacteraceae bacterium THAF1]|uniref:glutathione S-transferase family protein n=1 Tax=Palleronia sp. THAF1 TaxID=2587842 RepID=UPI000F3F344C|nr:glutathione S-transferase family protein [Palleronia sp. THAF1]QFU09129.1 Glutathione S-transferase GST-4.5 [Palleronia sp. THAF1]VDC24063.1 Glutathione S-transferase GST-4.5 [Rhodobacteraceae bacterium THAF1]